MGTVFNIQKFCLHDGDGIRTCVFLKGCPLRCIWCHNPEGLDKKPVLFFHKNKCTLCGSCISFCSARTAENGQLKIDREKCIACGRCLSCCLHDANEICGREMTAQEVFAEVEKDKLFYDASGGGITLTGGEPSMQPAFALELLQLAAQNGISAAVETCGIGSADYYHKAADLGAVFLYDIKCMDPVRHKMLTGTDNAKILANLQTLMDRGADLIIRLPLVPDCNDKDEDIEALCSFLNEKKGQYRYAEIMPYHTLAAAKAEKTGSRPSCAHDSATREDINRWLSLFARCGTDIKVSE